MKAIETKLIWITNRKALKAVIRATVRIDGRYIGHVDAANRDAAILAAKSL